MSKPELTVASNLSASLLKGVYTQHDGNFDMRLETLEEPICWRDWGRHIWYRKKSTIGNTSTG
ncbi:MAG: hypothetical protein N5P05_004442 (plasmid) [Chroococcopsis gigantea SAG 12.99]|nr:hypothetical protein [Chroococcopsis gigantea SAG 12.99]